MSRNFSALLAIAAVHGSLAGAMSGCSDSAASTPGSGGASTSAGTSGTSGNGGSSVSAGGSATGGTTAVGGGGTSSGGQTAGSAGAAGSGGTLGGGGSGGGESGTSGAAGASAGGAGGSGGTTHEPTFHVFLLLGQSNMAGYAKARAEDQVEDPRIRVLGFDDCQATGRETDVWDTAAPPLHECWNGAVGPGDHFAKTLLASLPSEDTIGLVPCAISGERIETFLKSGGSQYEFIRHRAELAQQAGGVVEGMLFHQGESNCGDNSWPGKVATLVSDLRADLALGNVPFLAGELLYSGNCSQHNSLVNQLPGQIENAFVVSAAGLAGDPADTQWNLHFGHDATVELGERYASEMASALGW